MSDVVIRAARLTDADQLFALVEQFATSYRPRREAFDRHLPQLLTADHVELLVGDVAGPGVGYAVLARAERRGAVEVTVPTRRLALAQPTLCSPAPLST